MPASLEEQVANRNCIINYRRGVHCFVSASERSNSVARIFGEARAFFLWKCIAIDKYKKHNFEDNQSCSVLAKAPRIKSHDKVYFIKIPPFSRTYLKW